MNRVLVAGMVLVLGLAISASGATFPLKTAEGGRYLVDQDGKPFLVVGDSAWSLIVQLGDADIDRYLEDRQKRGFNSIIVSLIEHGEALTAENSKLNFTVALSYGGRQDVVQAARKLAQAAIAGEIAPESIDQDAISRQLWTAELPDPDLVIRTSGEQRISNFFLWQSAYAELVFLDTLWPDFSKADLENAIREFRRRERRYGAVVTNR